MYVRLEILDSDALRDECREVTCALSQSDVHRQRDLLTSRILRSVQDGHALLAKLPEIFPRLVLGSRAEEQVAAMTGAEPNFRQVLRHLHLLNCSALEWKPEEPFTPIGLTFSVESPETLRHGKHGPHRDFPTPAEFCDERWSLHTKLTGSPPFRLYFKTREAVDPSSSNGNAAQLHVAIGYIGPHLPTVKFP